MATVAVLGDFWEDTRNLIDKGFDTATAYYQSKNPPPIPAESKPSILPVVLGIGAVAILFMVMKRKR